MTSKELTELLDSQQITYSFDAQLKLWLVFIDDMTLYIDPNVINDLTSDEFSVYLAKQLLITSSFASETITFH